MIHAFVQSIGMTLLHSLWQFTAVYLLLVVLLKVLKNSRSNTIYLLTLGLLGSGVIMAVLTFSHYYLRMREAEMVVKEVNALIGETSIQDLGFLFSPYAENTGLLDIFLPYLVLFYLIGMTIFSVRFLLSLLRIRSFKNRGIIPVNPELVDCMEKLVRHFNLRIKPVIKESVLIKVPIVMGLLKPVIVVPAGLLTHLPFNQVEAIIAHEIVHIKRNDFLINLIQSIIEIVFFYHPAVYLLSSQIRKERENCCDDMAIKACNDKGNYIKALTELESMNSLSVQPSLAFSGNKNRLLNRVKRILNQNTMKTKLSDKIFASIIILAGLSTLLLTGAAALNNMSGESDLKLENERTFQEIDQTRNSTSKDSIISIENGRITTWTEVKKGKDSRVEMSFRNGELSELIIDGKTIPSEEYKNYKELIGKTKKEVTKASREIEDAEKELESIDEEAIKREIELAMKEAKEINEEEIRMEIESAQREMEKINTEELMHEIEEAIKELNVDINWDSLSYEIQNSISSVDWDEISREIEEAAIEVQLSEEEMREVMDEVNRSMEEIDWEGIEQSIKDGLTEARIQIDGIDWDIIGESIALSLEITEDVLNTIQVELDENMKDIEVTVEQDLERARKDLNTEKTKLKDLEEEMEKALEKLEEDK